MCGIAGIYAYRASARSVDHDELVRMCDHMAARGPDGSGEWYSADRRVSLGHRRLSIIDLSARGAQPMQTPDGRLVITFNGEIYNYRALRSKLEAKGYAFQSHSDTEVLLHLYAELGHDMLRELRGMFAFALWDSQQQRLLLARDPYGIKPLYYADDGSTLRFASQVKALMAGGGVSRDPDPAGWAGFYLFGSVAEPFTTYREVRALPAGSFVDSDQRGLGAPVQYYSISRTYSEAQQRPPSTPTTTGEIKALVREALLDSVRHHLVADVPVGAFLSAGVDSGALVGLMREAGQQEIQTVTLAFDEFRGTPNDETPEAAAVAEFYATRHTTRVVGENEFRSDLPAIIEAMDQPTIDGINVWFVSKAAHELGLKVAISGLGGDELFGGYSSFHDLPTWVRWMAAPSAVPGLGRALRSVFHGLHAERLGLNPKAAGLVELGGSYPGAYLLRRGIFMPWELAELLGPDFAREGLKRFGPLNHIAGTLVPDPRQPFAQVATLESSLYMRNQLLRDTDWASMAHSLEVRVPLADTELLRNVGPIMCSSPAAIGKELLGSNLPAALDGHRTRKKTGFSTPIVNWLDNDENFRKPVRKTRRSHWSRRWLCAVAEQFGLDNLEHSKSAHNVCRLTAPESARKRVLISTLEPSVGGVDTMVDFVVRTVRRRNYEPVIAHYEPYSRSPQLSTPLFALMQRRPASQIRHEYGCESHAIGSWLPELEFTHYAVTQHWKKLIESCSAYVSVSGNVLAATPYYQTGKPFLSWVAAGWHDDRKNRVAKYPAVRKLLDRSIVAPNIKRLERSILRNGKIVALSQYTKRVLEGVAEEPIVSAVLSMPVDTTFWTPRPESRVAGRVGFCGRLNDPRKNIDLLLAAVARAKPSLAEISAVLIGGEADRRVQERLADLGIDEQVKFIPYASGTDLRDHLRSLELFVIPSHQEGLCIAALEAMACGCPVVSTCCGGPEEFVIDGETGSLVDFDAEQMAAAMLKVLVNRTLHAQLAQGARDRVVGKYSIASAESIFWRVFDDCFPDRKLKSFQLASESLVPGVELVGMAG
jgi:asparagine synthase (glutamine-hydrolysing)